MRLRAFNKLLGWGLILTFVSCAAPEPANRREGENRLWEKILATARSMIGRPYRYRGETPSGFDCSGLVRYCYRAAGFDIPHGTTELRAITRPIDYADIRKGDLVFFDRAEKKFGHVGIYAGNDRFVHAPRLGKPVRIDSLHDPYWKEHFRGARRL